MDARVEFKRLRAVAMPKKGGKEKKSSGGGGKGGGKKHEGPTEEERAELVLKVMTLEHKLVDATSDLERLALDHSDTKNLLAKQRTDQDDIVSYLKKELEKKTAENASLETKLVALREAKETSETALQQELSLQKASAQTVTEQMDSAVAERQRLEVRAKPAVHTRLFRSLGVRLRRSV